jgi:hypothetical protein
VSAYSQADGLTSAGTRPSHEVSPARPVSRLPSRSSGTPFACRRRGTGVNRETLESYSERAHHPWSLRRRRVQRPRVRLWFSALRRRSTAHHGDLRANAAPPSPMVTAPQRHTTVAKRLDARTQGKSSARWDPRGGCPSPQGEGRSLPRNHEVTVEPWTIHRAGPIYDAHINVLRNAGRR